MSSPFADPRTRRSPLRFNFRGSADQASTVSPNVTPMIPSTKKNACLSCRQRKLKCDKQTPCANCIARSVECSQQLLLPVSRGAKRPLDETETDPSTISNILSRLDRIEAFISRTQNNDPDGLVSTPIGNELNTICLGIPAAASKAHASSTETTRDPMRMPLFKPSANDQILVRL